MYVLKNSGIQQTSNNKGLFTSSKQYAVLVYNFYTSLFIEREKIRSKSLVLGPGARKNLSVIGESQES